MPSSIADTKRALRAELRERRRILTQAQHEAASEGFTQNLIALATRLRASTVALYLSTPLEPDTRGFLEWARGAGLRILLPVSREDGLLDWAVDDGSGDKEGLFGLPEPGGVLLSPMAVNDVDLIVLPAAAISRDGMRMGWGRGYYDKTLGSMGHTPPTFAVVHDHEILDEVPADLHDQPVSGAVTPTAIFDFSTR